MRRPFGIYLVAAWLFFRCFAVVRPPPEGFGPSGPQLPQYLSLFIVAAVVLLLIRLVQLHYLARWISIAIFCAFLFHSFYYLPVILAQGINLGVALVLIIPTLDALAVWYLLRRKLRHAALGYQKWRVEESRKRAATRLMKKDRYQ